MSSWLCLWLSVFFTVVWFLNAMYDSEHLHSLCCECSSYPGSRCKAGLWSSFSSFLSVVFFCLENQTLSNPAEHFVVLLLVCSGPREDATRIGSAGVIRRQAVDISPLRRVNQAIYLLTTGARESAFRNVKTIAECLADELINAAKGSSNRCELLWTGQVDFILHSDNLILTHLVLFFCCAAMP